ncbi:MAG: alpha/beta hydrolase family protein [Chthonomonadales bacterium]
MAFCEYHYFSNSLGKAMAANIIVPERADRKGPFAVFYLLHGLSDDHSIWQRRTSIERYVQDLPLIVVMPDGGRGWYIDAAEGPAWEASIIRDLVPLIDRTFHTKAERAGRAIGGLSMGGYGALRLSLGNPDMFCSANSHSGAVAFGMRPVVGTDPNGKEFLRVLGPNSTRGKNDLFALAEKVEKDKLPAMRIDCGASDFLLNDNRLFHKRLQDLNVAHEYEEFPGSHEWGYWDTHIQQALAFHRKNLGI